MEADIVDRVKTDFRGQSNQALELLGAFELAYNLSSRVTRCIVVLSKGDISKLNDWINEAKVDWRDVIDEAEEKSFQYKTPFES
ncbi:MAG: hypothetical protein AAF901_12890 [Bacteroidota bacterium]